MSTVVKEFDRSTWVQSLEAPAWIEALGRPDWIEALATVAAVIAAVYAGVYAKRAFVKEVDRDKERDEEQRRAQAGKVAAWCDKYDFAEPSPTALLATQGRTVTIAGRRDPWHYHLRNASDVPVYDVVILFRLGEHSLGTEMLDVLPPWDEPMMMRIPERIQKAALTASHEHGTVIRPILAFRDAAGLTWRRTEDGRLTPHTDFRLTAEEEASPRRQRWLPKLSRDR